jgi:2-oxoglutarate dehydrogenase E1 component
MQMIMFGHKKNQKHGAYSFMLLNFDFIQWRLASLKAMPLRQQEVIQDAKRRHADAIQIGI